jgi:ABC-type molybdenum transport system ATPase subunit/photorepair protein PhrA
MPKKLWFVAGVNGAGKTTLAREDAVRALLGAAQPELFPRIS